jgi:hypothetical protein
MPTEDKVASGRHYSGTWRPRCAVGRHRRTVRALWARAWAHDAMEKWLDGPGQRSAGLHCSYGLGPVDSFPINQITSQLLQDLPVQKYKT